jgi:hypothetical protein
MPLYTARHSIIRRMKHVRVPKAAAAAQRLLSATQHIGHHAVILRMMCCWPKAQGTRTLCLSLTFSADEHSCWHADLNTKTLRVLQMCCRKHK